MWNDASPVLKVSLMLKDKNRMKNSMTSLEPRSERSSPCCKESESVFNEMWFLTVDPFIRIRFHRKAFRAIRLLACFRGLS